MVTRAERGSALVTRSEATGWLDASGSESRTRDGVLALVEAAHTETRSWSDLLGTAGHLQGVAAGRERSARRARNFQAAMVPGLLQTAAYAQCLIPQADPTGQMDHAAALAARVERQQVLYEEGRRFEFVISEQVLHWSPGPDVLDAQLDRLASLATLPSVELAILPMRREGGLAWQSFILWEPADGTPDCVTMELLHGGPTITDPAMVERYTAVWDELRSASLTGRPAIDLLMAARRS